MTDATAERSGLGPADAVLAGVALITALGLVGLHLYGAAQMTAMLGDFGGDVVLPLLTRVVLAPAYGLVVALCAIGLCAAGAWLRHGGRPGGRALIATATLVSVVGTALFVVGAYLPVFELSGAIAQ